MNLGERYPRNNRPDFSVLNLHKGACPPRKWIYRSTSVGFLGLYAAPWLGQDILSTEYEASPDGQKLHWTVNHPTVPDNFIEIIWFLVEEASGDPRMHVHIKQEFWKSGIMYGDNEFNFSDADDLFLGATCLNSQSIEWQHRSNNALFRAINRSFFYAALWSDQPDYHPYWHSP